MKRISLLLLFSVFASLGRTQMNRFFPKPYLNDVVKAEQYMIQQLKKENIDPSVVVQYSCALSRMYNRQGKMDLSDSILKTIDKTNLTDKEDRFRWQLSKAVFYSFRNNPERATEIFDSLSMWCKQENRVENLAECYIEKGEFLRRFGQIEFGLAEIAKARPLIENNDLDLQVEAYFYNRRAALYNEFSRGDKALEDSKKCIEIASKINNQFLLGLSNNEIGYVYKHFRKLEKAIDHYELAEEAFVKANMLTDAYLTRFNRIEFCAHNDLYTDSLIGWFQQYMSDVETHQIPVSLRMPNLYLYMEYYKKKNYEKALRHFIDFHDIQQREDSRSLNERLTNIKEKYAAREIAQENDKIKSDLQFQGELLQAKNRTLFWVVFTLILVTILSVVTFRLYRKSNKLAKMLETKNKEKDHLLQEVHHRVKNNLNVVHSLLDMQSRTTTSHLDKEILEKASTRIESISLVHEMLYSDDIHEKVNVKEYVRQLIDNLLGGLDNRVATSLDIDELFMNSRDCMSIGLIITETFTNAMKYAFVNHPSPRFDLRLNKKGHGEIFLEMKDNGTTIVQPDQLNKQSSLGLRLIEIFSKQLRGSLEINYIEGLRTTLKFTLDD